MQIMKHNPPEGFHHIPFEYSTGFYEPRTTSHESLFFPRAEGHSRRCRQFESVAAHVIGDVHRIHAGRLNRTSPTMRPAICKLRPAGTLAQKFDER